MNTTQEPSSLLYLWQYMFLQRFGACRTHNATCQNNFCIDCAKAACQHCLEEGSHVNHSVIKIYTLVSNDVVSLDEMNRHMDCSIIQPYMSNGRLVLAISPLPHQGSGALKPHTACQFCARRLMDADRYRLCSIACKLGIDAEKATTKENPDQSAQDNCRDPPDSAGGNDGINTYNVNGNDASGCVKRPKPRISRRKGFPMRAPFY